MCSDTSQTSSFSCIELTESRQWIESKNNSLDFEI